jgi:tetratricopeptide (TPR) repeat protein
MFASPFSFPRFGLTFGLFIVAILIPLIIFKQAIKENILETQQYTSSKAKSQILGYQTPEFNKLAQDLLNHHVFVSNELDNYRAGTGYLSFYRKGVELFPELFELYYMQGICQFWMGDYDSAQLSFRKSLEINPVFFWSYYNLGLLYLKTGHIDAAIALLSRAREIPVAITVKFLSQLEAFQIIWKFMPDPSSYIRNRLEEANQNINYLLLIALAVKNQRASEVHFDPNQWHPIFF